jgi:redox-sensitive bicupin YhaK (pirin superfamily)
VSKRTVKQLVQSFEVTEGAGVTVHRSIGTPALRNLDPFLMLDNFSTDNPDDYIAGFPDHPHRGFNTFTYMIDGHMLHGDSMGNKGNLDPGGAQWMCAGSGVIHSEMPGQIDGTMRGFQLWINLPADKKMSDPAYQEIRPEAVPEVKDENGLIRVLAGQYNDIQGPAEDPNTQVMYIDVALEPGASFKHTLPESHAAFICVFEGEAQVADTRMPHHHLAVLSNGDELEISSGPDGARFILVAGKPIGEPIVQYGPFVMNNRAEIEQAMRDYHSKQLVRRKAEMKNI